MPICSFGEHGNMMGGKKSDFIPACDITKSMEKAWIFNSWWWWFINVWVGIN